MNRLAAGLKAWLIQRLSALYLAAFGSYLALRLTLAPPPDHAALVRWVTTPGVTLGLLLFVPLLSIHVWIGVRDILIDYARPLRARLVALTVTAFVLSATGLGTLYALLRAGID